MLLDAPSVTQLSQIIASHRARIPPQRLADYQPEGSPDRNEVAAPGRQAGHRRGLVKSISGCHHGCKS
jgi:hypothetical protein